MKTMLMTHIAKVRCMRMEKNKRLFLSVSEMDIQKLDEGRATYGMNRSQYIRHLLSKQKKPIAPSIKYQTLVERFNQIDMELRVIALKEELTVEEKLLVFTKIEELRELLGKGGGFGQLDQR